jgi:hypothetical protein
MDYSGGVGTPIWQGGAGRTPTEWYCAWDIYIAASVARAAEFAFTLPNSPSQCLPPGLLFQRLPPSRRWADDRNSSCRERIHPCHIIGIGRVAQQPPKPAAPAQQPAKPVSTAPAKPAAAQPAKPATTAAAPPELLSPLAGPVRRLGRLCRSPSGGKVCFALAKPKTTKIEPADASAIRPTFCLNSSGRKRENEVSVIIGYPFKTSSDATAEVGAASSRCTRRTMVPGSRTSPRRRMVDAMRKGADLTVKGTSGRGTASIDQYSLKGLAQALDKIEQECK